MNGAIDNRFDTFHGRYKLQNKLHFDWGRNSNHIKCCHNALNAPSSYSTQPEQRAPLHILNNCVCLFVWKLNGCATRSMYPSVYLSNIHMKNEWQFAHFAKYKNKSNEIQTQCSYRKQLSKREFNRKNDCLCIIRWKIY